jgi:hypothetical protein
MNKVRYNNPDMKAGMFFCPKCKGVELGFLIKSRSELLCNWCGEYSTVKEVK